MRRNKFFGYGTVVPLDRNAKVRVMALARGLSRRTEKHKHYGLVTAKALAVLGALLYGFHNCQTGRCFPSYEAIAEKAGCCRATVYLAIRALESAGILAWDNRIARIRERCDGLFGEGSATKIRVIRTSNAYRFNDPNPSKSKNYPGTTDQELRLRNNVAEKVTGATLDPDNPLHASLIRLQRAINRSG